MRKLRRSPVHALSPCALRVRVCTFDKNEGQRVNWVHSSVVRAADCRSAGPWFKSGCALEVFCTHSFVVRFERSRLVACKNFP